MKVLSFPNPNDDLVVGGISTVVKKYLQFSKDFDIDFVKSENEDFDVAAVHAGMVQYIADTPMVAHCHGFYWTAHQNSEPWEQLANRHVINSIRRADLITVPSDWVAETIRRDIHVDPFILPHGIDLDEWGPPDVVHDYMLWNKNRSSDVCDPSYFERLSALRPENWFFSTFGSNDTKNFRIIGPKPYNEMRELVRHCRVYVNTTEETFGIGILEAMACGVPILAFDYGGAIDLVEHGVNGYLAEPGNVLDLANGLDYCLRHRKTLGENGIDIASEWTWDMVMPKLYAVYQNAIRAHDAPDNVSVVIPCYNKADTLERAVKSVLKQTRPASEIIIVDNNSTDESRSVAVQLSKAYDNITVLNAEQQGVAHARNLGCYHSSSRYICCLDADDEILPYFLEDCCGELDKAGGPDLAYTKLLAVDPDGNKTFSEWPGEYNGKLFYEGKNQVPTCCVFKRDVFLRLGGYRQRYAPDGAGSEDAELWLRMFKHGYTGKLASEQHLFVYHLGGGVSGNPDYREVDWRYFHKDQGIGAVPLGSGFSVNAPIHKYNDPDVSVIIPCTNEHIRHVWDALDSLEGQTHPFWEAIVVFDGPIDWDEAEKLMRAFVFASFLHTDEADNPENKGAGAARNIGADAARSPYLLFLDADDWLEPKCIEHMLTLSKIRPKDIIYSDYIGRSFGVSNPIELQRAGRLLHYSEDDQFAIIRYKAFDYDCERAQRQPELDDKGQFYIWNLVTSLVPIKIHEEIGGFDEEMDSWEDWDYWIRIARNGHCFVRIAEELVSYRFYTGSRREIGRQRATKLLDYLRLKYEGEKPMPCGGCGRSARTVSPMAQFSNPEIIASSSPNDMVRVEFVGESFGERVTVRDPDSHQLHDYGWKSSDHPFLMLKKHALLLPNKFRVVPIQEPKAEKISQPEGAGEEPAMKESDANDTGEDTAPPPPQKRTRRKRATSSRSKKSS